MQIDLTEYPAAGPIAARAVERAKTIGPPTIFRLAAGRGSPRDVDFIKHGRKGWLEWWRGRFRRR
jgi:hypothetical protein